MILLEYWYNTHEHHRIRIVHTENGAGGRELWGASWTVMRLMRDSFGCEGASAGRRGEREGAVDSRS